MVGLAVNVTLEFEQIVVAEAEIITDGVTEVLTVIAIGVEVAVAGAAQVAVDVITQVTTSPFINPLLEYELPVPTLLPFTFHWYEGVPPLVGVAVKVIFEPEQIVVADAATDTAGTTVELTVIVIGNEVAVAGEAQEAVEVITQVT